jgi:hypothetical protein
MVQGHSEGVLMSKMSDSDDVLFKKAEASEAYLRLQVGEARSLAGRVRVVNPNYQALQRAVTRTERPLVAEERTLPPLGSAEVGSGQGGRRMKPRTPWVGKARGKRGVYHPVKGQRTRKVNIMIGQVAGLRIWKED